MLARLFSRLQAPVMALFAATAALAVDHEAALPRQVDVAFEEDGANYYQAAQIGQPPARPLPSAPAQAAPPSAATQDFLAAFAPPTRSRLASTPDMFGDFFGRGATLVATAPLPTPGARLGIAGRADMPLAGGARGLKVGEHNKALPVDRVYFNYNHFHNALQFSAAGLPAPGGASFFSGQDASIDRYTLGWEKTFADGGWSAELRMPLTGGYDFDFRSGVPNEVMAVEGGEVGNLAVILKTVLFQDEVGVIAAGLGVEAPTGSDATARLSLTSYRIENEAVHLCPWVGVMCAPSDDFFWHGFVQLDVAANGNPVTFAAPGGAELLGRYNEQTLLHVDLAVGYWLHRDPCAPLLTGLASIVEWHHTTSLQGSDRIAGSRPVSFSPLDATFDLRNPLNWFDMFHATAGLHAELAGDTTLRVGGVFPLREGVNRFFDAEVIVQMSRRF